MKFEIGLKNYYKAKEAMHDIARLHAYFKDTDGYSRCYYYTCRGIALALEKLGIIECADAYLYQEIEKAREEIEQEEIWQKAQQQKAKQ